MAAVLAVLPERLEADATAGLLAQFTNLPKARVLTALLYLLIDGVDVICFPEFGHPMAAYARRIKFSGIGQNFCREYALREFAHFVRGKRR